MNERFPGSTFWFHQGTLPCGRPFEGGFAQPVVDQENLLIRSGKLGRIAKCHARSGSFIQRATFRGSWCVRLQSPMRTPGVVPAEVRPVKRHVNTITTGLVIVIAKPMETIIHGQVPRVSHTPGDDFQVLAAIVTAQDATLVAPIIGRVLVLVLVGAFFESDWLGEIR